MKDISARELKGHNILAVERFKDNTRWMIEFSVLRPSTAPPRVLLFWRTGIRLMKCVCFLQRTYPRFQTENALKDHQRREIKIKQSGKMPVLLLTDMQTLLAHHLQPASSKPY